jgi:hypothetical protein
MPRYLLHSQHYLDGAVREAGDEIEFDGVPTPDMEGIDAEGKRRAKAAHADYFSDLSRPGFVKREFHLTPADESGEQTEETWEDKPKRK